MKKELNNDIFKFLVFLPILTFILQLVFLVVNPDLLQVITGLYIALKLYLFVKDGDMLDEKNAFAPHWAWVFIIPVYIYKRQKRNNLDIKYFWIALAQFIFLPIFSLSLMII